MLFNAQTFFPLSSYFHKCLFYLIYHKAPICLCIACVWPLVYIVLHTSSVLFHNRGKTDASFFLTVCGFRKVGHLLHVYWLLNVVVAQKHRQVCFFLASSLSVWWRKKKMVQHFNWALHRNKKWDEIIELMDNERLQSLQFLLCQWQLFLYDLMCCYSNCCYSRKENLV